MNPRQVTQSITYLLLAPCAWDVQKSFDLVIFHSICSELWFDRNLKQTETANFQHENSKLNKNWLTDVTVYEQFFFLSSCFDFSWTERASASGSIKSKIFTARLFRFQFSCITQYQTISERKKDMCKKSRKLYFDNIWKVKSYFFVFTH